VVCRSGRGLRRLPPSKVTPRSRPPGCTRKTAPLSQDPHVPPRSSHQCSTFRTSWHCARPSEATSNMPLKRSIMPHGPNSWWLVSRGILGIPLNSIARRISILLHPFEDACIDEEISNAPWTKTIGGWCNVAVQRSHGSGGTPIVALPNVVFLHLVMQAVHEDICSTAWINTFAFRCNGVL
jgi:hypothetical protein